MTSHDVVRVTPPPPPVSSFVILGIVLITGLCGCAGKRATPGYEAPDARGGAGSGDLGVRVAEQIANDSVWRVPVGRHLTKVDYNSRLRLAPQITQGRSETLEALPALIVAINDLTTPDNLKSSRLFETHGFRVDGGGLSGADAALLAAVNQPALARFVSPADANLVSARAAVPVLRRAIDEVNRGSADVPRLRMRADLGAADTGKTARVHIEGYDDLEYDTGPKSPFETRVLPPVAKPPAGIQDVADERGKFLRDVARVQPLKPVVEPRAGFINLARTPAERGDQLHISVWLDPAPPAAPPAVAGAKAAAGGGGAGGGGGGGAQIAEAGDARAADETPAEAPPPPAPAAPAAPVNDNPNTLPPQGGQTLEVDRMGLSYRLSADALFVNRKGHVTKKKDGTTDDNDSHDFIPAPSASLTLHYHRRTGNGAASDPFWNIWNDVIDPGLGLNVAALNFEDGTEIGVGGHVSLLHDVLKVGYGYNLTADREPRYWYFGIGVFETLNEIGKLGRDLTK